jgi:hypothetical protein
LQWLHVPNAIFNYPAAPLSGIAIFVPAKSRTEYD